MKVDYMPLTGGLDYVSGSVTVKAGMLADCLNFEQVFGMTGYRRIDGYERFDGRLEPHLAQYFVLEFDGGVTEPSVGDILYTTSSLAQLIVLQVNKTSGTWGSNAAGNMIVAYAHDGLVLDNYDIHSGSPAGPVILVAAADIYQGSQASISDHLAYKKLAQAQRRALIDKPPGEGAILGVAVYRDDVIAVRNNAGNGTANMWKSSDSGWVAIKTGLRPYGRWQFAVANFSGNTEKLTLYGVGGGNGLVSWDGTTFTQAGPIFGSQATSSTTKDFASGPATVSINESTRSWVVGDKITIYSKSNPERYIEGTISAYSHPSVTLGAVVVGLTGSANDWVINLQDGSDLPYLITEHKDHLFLAFRHGQLQTSNLGNPMVYTTTASLFGTGEEITGLISMKGGTLGISCTNKMYLLDGTSQNDWDLKLHATNLGSIPYTAQENSGNALMLGPRGLTSLQATNNFGGFEAAVWSRNVKPMLDQSISKITSTRMVLGKYQMRIYTNDGSVITACIMTPNAVIQPQDVSFTASKYNHIVSCVANGTINGDEALFFGTEDGYVMREDVGQSFDGEPIDAAMRLHFTSLKSPVQKKRYHKLTFEVDAPEKVDINFIQLFDLDDGEYKRSFARLIQSPGTGGRWDVSEWNNFFWSLPLGLQLEANIDGIGRNMGLLVWYTSDIAEPITIKGALTQYNILGMTR